MSLLHFAKQQTLRLGLTGWVRFIEKKKKKDLFPKNSLFY
jgi:hypothetical protein